MTRTPGDDEEPSYRQAILILLAVLGACVCLYLAALSFCDRCWPGDKFGEAAGATHRQQCRNSDPRGRDR
jgi:hypothetical protein